MSKFEMPKNILIPTARVEKTGEKVLAVAFDLGLETGERPLALIYERHNGELFVRKALTDDEAMQLYDLIAK